MGPDETAEYRLCEFLWPDGEWSQVVGFLDDDGGVDYRPGPDPDAFLASYQPTYQEVSDALDHPDQDVREWVQRNWVANLPEPAQGAA